MGCGLCACVLVEVVGLWGIVFVVYCCFSLGIRCFGYLVVFTLFLIMFYCFGGLICLCFLLCFMVCDFV